MRVTTFDPEGFVFEVDDALVQEAVPKGARLAVVKATFVREGIALILYSLRGVDTLMTFVLTHPSKINDATIREQIRSAWAAERERRELKPYAFVTKLGRGPVAAAN